MRKLFVGDFDFERRLVTRSPAPAGSILKSINEDLACVWIAVADDGDLIWTPAPVEESFFKGLALQGFSAVTPIADERAIVKPAALVPWGWTDAMRTWGTRQGLICDGPAQAAVRAANSRTYSFELEQEWDVGLIGTGVIQSSDDFIRLVRSLPACDSRWIIKAEFSMAGRERIYGTGKEPSEQSHNWVSKRLQRGEVLFFEPWKERVDEVGLQFTVSRFAEPVFEAAVPMLIDHTGSYQGSCFAHDDALESRWNDAIQIGQRAARRLKELGYFGPLGIDAVRYRDADGTIGLRPLQDINARHTMGRLSVGLRRLLAVGETGSWLQLPSPAAPESSLSTWLSGLKREIPSGSRLISLSPDMVGGRPVRRCTLVVISKTESDRSNVEARLSKRSV